MLDYRYRGKISLTKGSILALYGDLSPIFSVNSTENSLPVCSGAEIVSSSPDVKSSKSTSITDKFFSSESVEDNEYAIPTISTIVITTIPIPIGLFIL